MDVSARGNFVVDFGPCATRFSPNIWKIAAGMGQQATKLRVPKVESRHFDKSPTERCLAR